MKMDIRLYENVHFLYENTHTHTYTQTHYFEIIFQVCGNRHPLIVDSMIPSMACLFVVRRICVVSSYFTCE